MSTDEQAERTSGSVPNAFRNALFWRWAPAMPKGLPSAFVTLLYALSSAADPAGKLKFRDGTVIRIKDISAACKADEKDCRRYVEAGIAAGIVAVEGERKRGRAALYVLVVNPAPDWVAAVHSIRYSKRHRKERQAPPWRAEENGGPPPELEEPENGGPPPVITGSTAVGERGAVPRMGSGDRPPFGSGDRPPNNPGSTHGVSHDGAEVVPQPQVDPGWDLQEPPLEYEPDPDDDGPGDEATDPGPEAALAGFTATRCTACHDPMVHRPGRPNIHAHCARDQPGAA